MPERNGHVLLGVNALILGYLPAAWKSPRLTADAFHSGDYWRQIGAIAERGTLDALFLADSPSLGNPGQDANPAKLDPTVTWAHVARHTSHIGLIATASTTFNDPFELAERILTLDVVSGGRAGWNLVTSRDPQAAANFGLDGVPTREERYARGAEFADAVVGLWDSARTGEELSLDGEHLRVSGRLCAPASPQGRPVLFQAGGSPQGRALAGRLADGVFTAELTTETAVPHYQLVKDAAQQYGRTRDEVKILPGLLLSLGSTEEEARRRSDELHEASPAAYSARWLSQAIGFDVSTLDLDEKFPSEVLDAPLDPATFTGSIGFRESILQKIRATGPTVREYLRETRYSGSGHGGFVGTPEQLADRIEEWYRLGAWDGVNLQPDVLLEGLEVIADEVVPILRRRGLYRHEYETSTLRGHFQAAGPSA
ncbi:NtaA/DmoA family FMN-dependent monooxygenase [Sediminivirga luteola]|uniref:Monooxygenase n=1 Tax=Sediminivirga luteola TaxID=1774748 RepID=A0A8J2TZB5_9MICO|nr:NtaA/DmoA family FMN-dependent monooxygenase [Sediminivirga luteola]GGA19901.1 monooxygenase [Sediminivirga luteola]